MDDSSPRVAPEGEDDFEIQSSAHIANMEHVELAENWDYEANVSQNDDIEVEKKDESSIRLIPGYATFEDYIQVCLFM